MESKPWLFDSMADVEIHQHNWREELNRRSVEEVLNWITGVISPYTSQEPFHQMHILLTAIESAAKHDARIKLPARERKTPRLEAWVISGYRNFPHQYNIWQRKFTFEAIGDFGPITDHARQVANGLILPDEFDWNPREPRHRLVWGADVDPNAKCRSLTEEERQEEILQTSSAPGTSRHHWGTEYDLFDRELHPDNWIGEGEFAGTYEWLAANAATYGFIQPYNARPGRGYIEERWHWSYYPVAGALLDFIKAHEAEYEAKLNALWEKQELEQSQGQNQFSFVRRHWRDYVYNVKKLT
jgi:hypothetical protein